MSAAFFTRMRDDIPFTTAFTTGRTDRKESLGACHLACSFAIRAVRRISSRFSPGTMAGFTDSILGYFNLAFLAECSIMERDLQIISEIRTRMRPRSSPTRRSEPEKVFKDVSK